MHTVTVSPKFQVVIPREIREALGLRGGRRLMVFRHGRRIEMVPLVPARELRGALRGIDTSVPRDGDRA